MASETISFTFIISTARYSVLKFEIVENRHAKLDKFQDLLPFTLLTDCLHFFLVVIKNHI